MRGVHLGCLVALVALAQVTLNFNVSFAQTTISGTSLVLHSTAGSSGTSRIIDQNGYVGTYITVPQTGGSVTFTVSASGTQNNSVSPDMTVSIADYNQSFSVTSSSLSNYNYTTPVLPGGTYFVRTQLDNQSGTATPTLNIGSLTVSGATVSNSATDQNALDAANNYINNFRQGTANLSLAGVLPANANVTVTMLRNGFNFGGTVSGTSTSDSKNMIVSNPSPTSEAGQFQSFINQYFNTIVPSNAGKWDSNEPTQGNVNMQLVDTQMAYAKSHNMTARMHNLIWGQGQQPTWVNSLINSALSGNATAKSNLDAAITNRINYYVGGTNAGNAERAANYVDVDGLNEELHSPTYQTIFGYSGLAKYYNQMLTAAAAAGNPNLRTMTNEFNVLQFSPATLTPPTTNFGIGGSFNPNAVASGSDPYANWYRQEVEGLNNAGNIAYGHNVVTGIGFQMYSNVNQTGSNAVSTNTMQQALQNLSVEGLPLTMTEFGMANSTNSQTLGPAVMDEAVRMVYGNPLADGFMNWGWWDTSASVAANGAPPAQMIVTTPGASGYTLTPLGQEWVSLMNAFTTPTQTATVDSSGNLHFSGFYGEYALSSNGNIYATVDFEKGASPVLWVKGDYNLDGKLTNADLQARLSALTNITKYQSTNGMSNEEYLAICDINGDGQVNKSDAHRFDESADRLAIFNGDRHHRRSGTLRHPAAWHRCADIRSLQPAQGPAGFARVQ